MNRYVVSVLVADRVGILRDVTSAVTDMGANIDGFSQTVVAGYFTVILTTSFHEPRSPESIRENILRNFGPDEAAVVVQPYAADAVGRIPVKGARYIVTVTGVDKPGILKTITGYFADKGINVEDWFVEFDGGNVRHIGEVSVPKLLDIKQVQEEFQHLLSAMDMDSFIQHENIFKATNEIGAIGAILSGGR
ncbi:MAG: ACT domain-containing protein [bacterium]